MPEAFYVITTGGIALEQSMMNEMTEGQCSDVMNVKRLCKALDIGYTTAYRILQIGKLHSMKVGRSYKIPKFILIEYLRGI